MGTVWSSHSTAAVVLESGVDMAEPVTNSLGGSLPGVERRLPEGIRDDLDNELPRRTLLGLRSLLQQGGAVLPDRDHALVADDDDFARVLLHFGGVCGPLKILVHPQLARRHRPTLHGPSG